MSVIVPTLDESAALTGTLDALAALPGRFEVVVADGGSGDGTPEIAAAHPRVDQLVQTRRGRGPQMNAGAAVARGDVLLFLHADTRLPREAWGQIASALGGGDVVGGNFRLMFDGGGLFDRFLGLVYATQRRWGVFYGDSAIFLRRDAFAAVGGFPQQDTMEDFEMARRIVRSGRSICLPGPAITSSRRWQRMGIARTVATWLTIRWLYQLGISPARLARLYRVAR